MVCVMSDSVKRVDGEEYRSGVLPFSMTLCASNAKWNRGS